jgi:outer membrane protein assembly factor BamB
VRWNVSATVNNEPCFASGIAIGVGDVVYAPLCDVLQAFEGATGANIWLFTPADSDLAAFTSPSLAPDGTIFIGAMAPSRMDNGTNAALLAVDSSSGSQMWSQTPCGTSPSPTGVPCSFNSPPLTGVTGNTGLVYAGSVSGSEVGLYPPALQAFNVENGSVAWSFVAAQKDFGLIGTPAASPDGSTVYLVNSYASLIAVDAASGEKLFSLGPLDGPVAVGAIGANSAIFTTTGFSEGNDQ